MDSKRIYLTSCELGKGAWRANEVILERLYQRSDKRHQLVDRPEQADLILVGNVREENWGEKTLTNELIRHSPAKCFSLSDADQPLFMNHGIYPSATQSLWNWRRVASGCYAISADRFRNTFIENHDWAESLGVQKRWLFSFLGRESSPVRSQLFRLKFDRNDVLVENTSTFDLWELSGNVDKIAAQKRYYTELLASKFSLCPRGVGAGSLRLFESMQLGIAPVILSDGWAYPMGPQWKNFSISVKERHVGDIQLIVGEHEKDFEEMGRLARQAFDQYFADSVYFNYVVDCCMQISARQLVPESIYWRISPLVILGMRVTGGLKRRLRKVLKKEKC